MKKFLQNMLLLAVTSVTLWSCEKDEIKAVLGAGTEPTISASAASLVLTSANPTDTVQTLTWAPSDFGYQAGVKYILQVDKAGNDFQAATEYTINGLTKKFTSSELNTLAILKGLAPDTEGTLEARVTADVGSGVETVSSQVISMKVTPYLVIINYPSLYVPGDYQGWNPGGAPKISSVRSNNDYEGYVYITPGSLEFKLTSQADWNGTNYGDGGNGTLSTDGGNLKVPSAGYYRLKANTTTKTWAATKTDWGLIGDATGSWDNDQNMTWDAATSTWTITMNLLGGKEIKFRANDGWDINMGDDNADKSLEYGGANIKIPEDGNYTVTLNLSVPGNYTYSVIKN